MWQNRIQVKKLKHTETKKQKTESKAKSEMRINSNL